MVTQRETEVALRLRDKTTVPFLSLGAGHTGLEFVGNALSCSPQAGHMSVFSGGLLTNMQTALKGICKPLFVAIANSGGVNISTVAHDSYRRIQLLAECPVGENENNPFLHIGLNQPLQKVFIVL